jgi:hypothetical protein
MHEPSERDEAPQPSVFETIMKITKLAKFARQEQPESLVEITELAAGRAVDELIIILLAIEAAKRLGNSAPLVFISLTLGLNLPPSLGRVLLSHVLVEDPQASLQLIDQ